MSNKGKDTIPIRMNSI